MHAKDGMQRIMFALIGKDVCSPLAVEVPLVEISLVEISLVEIPLVSGASV